MKETLKEIQQDKDFEKIRTQLTKYLDSPIPARRGQVFKSMSAMEGKYPTELIVEAILDLLEELDKYPPDSSHLLNYWRDRLQGAPVVPIMSSSVYGKWSDSQVVAESLPLQITERLSVHGYEVNLWGNKREYQMWVDRGFLMAEPLPVVRRDEAEYVSVAQDKWKVMARNGYAEAQPLPWTRRIEESSVIFTANGINVEEDRPGLYVERSIIAHGFWKAYKWWAGCRYWYYERHPEWFWDDPIWGSEVVEVVIVPEGAAVISPQSLELFQRLNLTG
ncbi:hypothetical protein [Coleofasciculus sp.]|uniref:hypothetical protein n=1 Tax=Coleofasciculus sp. TaxID=3100458 RepID=UPI0039FAEAE2